MRIVLQFGKIISSCTYAYISPGQCHAYDLYRKKISIYEYNFCISTKQKISTLAGHGSKPVDWF